MYTWSSVTAYTLKEIRPVEDAVGYALKCGIQELHVKTHLHRYSMFMSN